MPRRKTSQAVLPGQAGTTNQPLANQAVLPVWADDLPDPFIKPSRVTEAYTVFDSVPILDEHTLNARGKDGRNRSIDINRQKLSKIADNNNHKITQTGDMVPIVIGHTEDGAPEKDQPEVVGYADHFHVAPLFQTGRLALHARFRYFRGKEELAAKYPRRSVELWMDDWEIDPISLLGATAPERPLGLIRLSRRTAGGTQTYPIKYELGSQATTQQATPQQATPQQQPINVQSPTIDPGLVDALLQKLLQTDQMKRLFASNQATAPQQGSLPGAGQLPGATQPPGAGGPGGDPLDALQGMGDQDQGGTQGTGDPNLDALGNEGGNDLIDAILSELTQGMGGPGGEGGEGEGEGEGTHEERGGGEGDEEEDEDEEDEEEEEEPVRSEKKPVKNEAYCPPGTKKKMQGAGPLVTPGAASPSGSNTFLPGRGGMGPRKSQDVTPQLPGQGGRQQMKKKGRSAETPEQELVRLRKENAEALRYAREMRVRNELTILRNDERVDVDVEEELPSLVDLDDQDRLFIYEKMRRKYHKLDDEEETTTSNLPGHRQQRADYSRQGTTNQIKETSRDDREQKAAIALAERAMERGIQMSYAEALERVQSGQGLGANEQRNGQATERVY